MTVVLDFDSTLIKDESLDILAKYSDNPNAVTQIQAITDKAMSGELSFELALQQRLALLKFNHSHLENVIAYLRDRLAESIIENYEVIQQHARQCFIVSGGFVEIIYPIMEPFGFSLNQIFANEFVWDENNNLIGANQSNPLAKEKGKAILLASLKLSDHIIMIGDGYTDYEVKAAGVANEFWAYTENVSRPEVTQVADKEVKDFNRCIQLLGWK